VGFLFVSTQSIYAEESGAFGKIRDVFPHEKIAVSGGDLEGPEHIHSDIAFTIFTRRCGFEEVGQL
jgi:hypothetical protein